MYNRLKNNKNQWTDITTNSKNTIIRKQTNQWNSIKKKTFNQLLLKTHEEVHITLSNSSKEINKYILRRRSKEIYDFVINNIEHLSEIEKNRTFVVKNEIFSNIDLLFALVSHGSTF